MVNTLPSILVLVELSWQYPIGYWSQKKELSGKIARVGKRRIERKAVYSLTWKLMRIFKNMDVFKRDIRRNEERNKIDKCGYMFIVFILS